MSAANARIKSDTRLTIAYHRKTSTSNKAARQQKKPINIFRFFHKSPSLPSFDTEWNPAFWRSFGTYCTVALFDPRLLTKFVSASRAGWVRQKGPWGYERGGECVVVVVVVVRWDRKASLCTSWSTVETEWLQMFITTDTKAKAVVSG
jgi:hypothetical protein